MKPGACKSEKQSADAILARYKPDKPDKSDKPDKPDKPDVS
jgi:hypothetical protein